MKKLLAYITILTLALFIASCRKEAGYRALIVTGQSEHNWQASSPVLEKILESTGLFSADIAITPEKDGDMSSFKPVFSRYDLVVLDYSGDSWPEETMKAFTDYVRNGGGVVVYHGSSISFPDWKEYNEITGLGGWNNRNEKDGPYVYYSRNRLVYDSTAGPAGGHGERHEFEIRMRISDHPVTKGLPVRWMHGSDELYQQLRGPAKNLQVLATAYADTAFDGTGRDEPVLMTINYGEGRIFHTAIGHADEGGGPAMECTGFIVTLQRGAEWAATGNVTQAVPYDFPTAAGVFTRPGFDEITIEQAFERLATYEIQKSTRYITLVRKAISDAAGDPEKLSELERRMVALLKDPSATTEAKKLILKELSWTGSAYTVEELTKLPDNQDLKEEIEFALERLK
jgi:type 1 glutamine amidotransferase